MGQLLNLVALVDKAAALRAAGSGSRTGTRACLDLTDSRGIPKGIAI